MFDMQYLKAKIIEYKKLIKFFLKKIKIKILRVYSLKKDLSLQFLNNFYNYKCFLKLNKENDFIYLLLMLKIKLKNMAKEWSKADHEKYLDEQEKLQELIQILNKMIDIALENNNVEKNQEYQKLSKSFFNKLHRLHDKLYM